jgi:hypothetical protein
VTGSVTVRGGADSIAADFDQLRGVASALQATATRLRSIVAAAARGLADPALFGAGVADPVGAVEVASSASLTIASAGAAVVECEALSMSLLAAVTAYQGADNLDRRFAPLIDGLALLPGAVLRGAVEIGAGVFRLDPGVALRGLVRVAEADPQLADVVIDLAADAAPQASGLNLRGPDQAGGNTAAIAGQLGVLYPDGTASLRRMQAEPTLDAQGPPRGVADLIHAISLRDDSTDGGGVDVRIVGARQPDGSIRRSAIVDLPGTKDWDVTTFRDPNVSNVGTDLRALAEERTTYESGVLLALKASGITPDEPVMLVGHSQGGMVAARMAAELAHSREFRVTHVVTAGSPIGLVDVPSPVQMLCLENKGDAVPELDGIANPARPNQTTVSIDRGGTGFGARHSLSGAYLPGARDVDASDDPSVRAWLASAADFLRADTVTTTVFQIDRQP